ncbi:hypothetical protein [Bradyrhizobium sp. JYMT SZCCT0428]|uniref:hypothetical protein n=1 Tax=Bradyrhizobium sp. JYMT SZCCT0428 TaxID=2807673 RepID=UPI001BA9A43D|nr:hypothetical protein [Bradyrhizobium sp. JYMT SZCCT0428]MBR1154811.1 hypothetical protein [Bradyrhizobium sp. JYMT SZCCT0428]
MSSDTARQAMEYASIGAIDVVNDKKRRDIMIGFHGDPNEEEKDLYVRFPPASAPVLAVLLHKAVQDLDKSASETSVVGQALTVSGAHSLEPVMGECAIEVTCLGFHLPLVMPKQVALNLIAELYKSLEGIDQPSPRGKPS